MPPARNSSATYITYVKTGEGWLYLATVIDCCTKEVIGYAMDDHYQTPLISRAIRNAARNRNVLRGLGLRRSAGYLLRISAIELPHSGHLHTTRGGTDRPADATRHRPPTSITPHQRARRLNSSASICPQRERFEFLINTIHAHQDRL
ncbi:DDE-type integrase/transposase/recombinase [Streptomyces olivoreticuli]|uniref:DDE-type integrase/transposase/recombinase n=1 Tax=Streptomyces olivoreticuli TaxID=68246 RepID=UPI003461ED1F